MPKSFLRLTVHENEAEDDDYEGIELSLNPEDDIPGDLLATLYETVLVEDGSTVFEIVDEIGEWVSSVLEAGDVRAIAMADLVPPKLVEVLTRTISKADRRDERIRIAVAVGDLVLQWNSIYINVEQMYGHLALAHGLRSPDIEEPQEDLDNYHSKLIARHVQIHHEAQALPRSSHSDRGEK